MIKPKKIWGQHFLEDPSIAKQIANHISPLTNEHKVLEIGPGKGMLTEFLLKEFKERLYAIEVDDQLITYLAKRFPDMTPRLYHGDFLHLDLSELFPGELTVAGNFPYNISSQIVFKILDFRDQVSELVGMFQKEMAQRIVASPGTKNYGIISVFTKCYYDSALLMEVNEDAFSPTPNIKSAVIKLTRNTTSELPCDETLFKTLVKAAFNQRRKKLRNSLKPLSPSADLLQEPIFDMRPEQLTVNQFFDLTNSFHESR